MRRLLLSLPILLSITSAQSAPIYDYEIVPTAVQIKQALHIFAQPAYPTLPIQLHFRTTNGITLACAYYGGTGGFCTKTPLSLVRTIDIGVSKYCADPANDAYPQPAHALTGEADGLDYRCVNGHMKRKPYSSLFDKDGFMIGEWKVLQ